MIFAIESSCDESALALFTPSEGLLGEWVHSQLDLHKIYGGVVPDLASREHLANFPWLLQEAQKVLAGRKPTLIAVTHGPGLAGCLALGVALAKSLALAWECPLVGVNHLRGHAFSPFIATHAAALNDFPNAWKSLLPHLGLIVSGGNTVLFAIDRERQLTILAQTVDDAAGEGLDKGAKLLGLPYPGGPHIEKLAATGDPKAYDFPRAFPSASEMHFSFSGLKTSLRYLMEKLPDDELQQCLPNLCASYQTAVIDALSRKTTQALTQYGPFVSLGLSGGVANNKALRSRFADLASRRRIPLLAAHPRHTGDNAAMIAFAAYVDPAACKQSIAHDLAIMPSMGL
ncbi:MAG: tRNA (adenosine(37)-N6)-threonylcarbamoyltransferase complex transferase subunit TsaD [Verrucomicrobiota bacterium]|nr:tRNA (adenosine(37)-N6)-threonylcarbamoyltransferase complex transferase subunit TsaD [Verrucomicrobiota bacterium]